MSQQNVELVLKMHAAYGRGDLEAFLVGWDPDGVYRAAITQAVEGERSGFRGHDGLRRWWRDLHDLCSPQPNGARCRVWVRRDHQRICFTPRPAEVRTPS